MADIVLTSDNNLAAVSDVAAARSNLGVYPATSLYTRSEIDALVVTAMASGGNGIKVDPLAAIPVFEVHSNYDFSSGAAGWLARDMVTLQPLTVLFTPEANLTSLVNIATFVSNVHTSEVLTVGDRVTISFEITDIVTPGDIYLYADGSSRPYTTNIMEPAVVGVYTYTVTIYDINNFQPGILFTGDYKISYFSANLGVLEHVVFNRGTYGYVTAEVGDSIVETCVQVNPPLIAEVVTNFPGTPDADTLYIKVI